MGERDERTTELQGTHRVTPGASSAGRGGSAPAGTDWEQIFDAVTDPMAILTREYRVLHANAAYLRAFGRTSAECEGNTCFASGDGHEGPCAGCPLPRTVQSGLASFTRQIRLVPVAPDGAGEASGRAVARIYEIWTYPLKTAAGEVERVVEILKDVTEREQLRQAMSEAEVLREADRLKAELLGTVSHELRSPLSAVKGYAATLLRHEERLPPDERREFLQAIVSASDRLEEVINRLLEMSQLETGAIQLHLEAVDVAHVARDALQAAEHSAAQRAPGRFTFVWHEERRPVGRGRPGDTVRADPRRLREVLDQLLENAVKYSPNGGTITVSLRRVGDAAAPEGQAESGSQQASPRGEHPDGSMEMVIEDSGQGIAAEELSHIFERFHRVDTRLTREADGLGLGLAIAKRIIELHGGSIWAQSAPGAGSAFHILLPIERSPRPGSTSPAASDTALDHSVLGGARGTAAP